MLAVLEVGLGGRLDATNLRRCRRGRAGARSASIIATGSATRSSRSAREKAGIFRRGRPAVLGSRRHAGERVRSSCTSSARAPSSPSATFTGGCTATAGTTAGLGVVLADLPPPALAGADPVSQCRHRAGGARGARAACAASQVARLRERSACSMRAPLRRRLPACVWRAAFRWCPARWSGFSTSRTTSRPRGCSPRSWRSGRCRAACGGRGRRIAVIGVLRDKDAAAIARALAAVVDRWIVCALPGARGEQRARSSPRAWRCPPAASRRPARWSAAASWRARPRAPGDRVVVCGSVYTVGPALRWLRLY